ncbi:MAG: Fic family protein, partial [Bacteroidetes bacterium]|nr:Fic family protein [Bacteroidota bacterium]
SGYAYMPYVSHEKYIEDNKPDYYISLRTSQKTFKTDTETIVPWLDFFLNIVYEQSRQALDLLSGENLDKLLSPTQLKVWVYMQERNEVSPKELSEVLFIPRPTINQVTNRLIYLKKIERIGAGRATRYRKVK